MRDPQNRLFWAVFCAVLAFSGSNLFAACEDRLYHQITKATLRLFESKILALSDIEAMANSETPLNPLAMSTPVSRTSAAIQFYKTVLGDSARAEWPRVRKELLAELKKLHENVHAERDAHKKTEAIFHIKRIIGMTGGTILESKVLNGKVYYARRFGPMIEIYRLLEADPIWKKKIDSPQVWVRMNLDDIGIAQAKIFTPYSVDTINLQTHAAHVGELSGDPNNFINFETYVESVEPISRIRTFCESGVSFMQQEFVGDRWINLLAEPITFEREKDVFPPMRAEGIKLRTGQVVMYGWDGYIARYAPELSTSGGSEYSGRVGDKKDCYRR